MQKLAVKYKDNRRQKDAILHFKNQPNRLPPSSFSRVKEITGWPTEMDGQNYHGERIAGCLRKEATIIGIRRQGRKKHRSNKNLEDERITKKKIFVIANRVRTDVWSASYVVTARSTKTTVSSFHVKVGVIRQDDDHSLDQSKNETSRLQLSVLLKSDSVHRQN